MSVDITTLTRPRDLDTASSITMSSVYFMLDSSGWTLPRGMTAANFLTEALGANYARTLNVDAALSGSLQSVEVGGTASALQVSTTAVKVAGNFSATGSVTAGGLLSASTLEANVISDIGGSFTVDSNGVGFFGASAQAQPNVTGSRGGNAALASLLTALATLGLITNSTSA